MKRLCIIPARGGSKRLPGKNIALLGGESLIYHTMDAVVGFFGNVVITSDDRDILIMVSVSYPGHFAHITLDMTFPHSDTSKAIECVRHYFDKYGLEYDQIWLCLPTCPLRTRVDVQMAQGLLTPDIDGVVSITDYEFPPTLGLQKEYGDLIHDWLDDKPYQNDNTRSQNHPKIYRPNGAVYGMWTKSFEKSRNFFKGKIRGYYMPRERSVDIDTELDLKVAEVLLNEKN